MKSPIPPLSAKPLEPWQTWTPPPRFLKGVKGPDAVRAFLRVQCLLRDYVKPEHVNDYDVQECAGVQFYHFAEDQFAWPLTWWRDFANKDHRALPDPDKDH